MKAGQSLKDCFAVLGLAEGSGLDDVKRAYRKRAFELHPDLNPTDGASRQFQQLNEAYVVLIRLLDTKTRADERVNEQANDRQEASAASAQAGRAAYQEQAKKEQEQARKEDARREKERREAERKEQRARRDAERREHEERAREAKEREMRQEKEQREAERRARLQKEIERQEAERLARQEKAQQEREQRAEARKAAEKAAEEAKARMREDAARPESHRRAYAKPRPGGFGGTAPSGAPGGASGGTAAGTFGPGGAQKTYAAGHTPGPSDRETLLNDLLSDPFARRVYEDIYREVQHRKESGAPDSVPPPAEGPLLPPELAKSVSKAGAAIKDWLRGQIDEEQELAFPAANLYPGARIRLQIRRGITSELKTVEVTLPPDFAVGKPLRLRGMGRKIGRWQGDLYLTFQHK